MVNVRIKIEDVSAATFPSLRELVEEQALHHNTTYRGDDSKFVAALNRKDAAARVMIARNDDTGEPLGYILFNHYHGAKGQELYIEDILVSQRIRSNGLGVALMEELKAEARALGVDKISWAVADNNPRAIGFYENKVGAHRLSSDVYDGSILFDNPPVMPPGVDVARVGKTELALLETYVGILPGLDDAKMANIRDAATAPNSAVYLASSSDGLPIGLAVTNSNYSSFRTVYGYKLELMELTKDDVASRDAFSALTAHVAAEGKKADHTGHMNFAVDTKSPAQSKLMKDFNLARLRMRDDEPESAFQLYGIGRDVIYAPPAPSSAANHSSSKKPEAPKAP